MHGMYIFLTDGEDESAEYYFSHWEDSYANNHCDENNWYAHVATLANGKTYGGENFEEETKKVLTKEKVLNDAMQICATDMRLYDAVGISLPNMKDEGSDKIASMNYQELLEAITYEVPNMLSDLYGNAVGSMPQTGYDKSVYLRQSVSRAYEKFMDSALPPFTEYGTSPYNYRLFDLRYDKAKELRDEDVVLYIDIHT